VHMYNVTADDVLYEMAAEAGVDMKKWIPRMQVAW
jgi:hypothetical protein